MFRYTFDLENETQGWSETFFRANAFTSADQVYMDQYINRRLELMAGSTRIISVRGSNTDTKRDVSIQPLPTGGRYGSWLLARRPEDGGGLERTFPEDSFTALALRLTDGNQNWRNFNMLAFPDHIFVGNQIDPTEEALVRSRLNNWISAVQQAGFGMKAQGVPAASGRIVQFYPKDADNKLVTLGISGVPPAVGTVVTLNGVKPFNDLNRQWRVAKVDAAAGADPAYIYLAGSKKLDAFGTVEGGSWKVPTYALTVLNSYSISRLTSRKTGVPFSTVRGRR